MYRYITTKDDRGVMFGIIHQYESISRDSQDATLQFVPFSLVVKLPPLRKARLTIERNKLGQVVEARASFVRKRHFSYKYDKS